MQVFSLSLTDVGRFADLTIYLAPTSKNPSNVTVLVGNNGAGKTTVLKSLATSLSWLVARIRSEKGVGSPITDDVIRNNSSIAMINVAVIDTCNAQSETLEEWAKEILFSWTVARGKRGRKSASHSVLADATLVADHYRTQLLGDDSASLPLIAYYPVERSVLEIPLKIRTKHSFDQLDGYDNSLNRGVDFRRFSNGFASAKTVRTRQVFQIPH